MTRRGKIARLPKVIRDELNLRLRDGGRVDHLPEWEQTQEVAELTRGISDYPERFQDGLKGTLASGCFSTLLAVNLVELSKLLLDNSQSLELRWNRFCRVHEQLSRLRRDDHRRVRRRLAF